MPFVRRNAGGFIEAAFAGPENCANEEVLTGRFAGVINYRRFWPSWSC
ncbi:MAG: hypothetical protein QF394_03130 [Rhodospirillales bacterium]|nr:hypothetical protein [Rhodospirillales bacterium]